VEQGGSVEMTGGSIITTNPKGKRTQDGDGSRAYAIHVKGTDSILSGSNVAIRTEGQRAYGAHAIDGGTIDLTDGAINTHGFMAYGVYASGENSALPTNNVNISTTRDAADAVWAYKGGTATINGGIILV